MVLRKALVYLLLTAWVALPVPSARAEVKPHTLISDGMVLQQDIKVPIWGRADNGEKVTVRFQDQEVSATAENGRWLVRLENLKAGGPYELTIAGTNTIKLKNVLVGEVYICSGQSNMEWPLRLSAEPEKAIENSKNPMLRLFTVPKVPTSVPVHTVQGTWQECGPETSPNFSAVAYFFGRDLQKALQVPVGLIHTSWGGTPAESWTSESVLKAEPSLKYLADRQAKALEDYPKALERYIEKLSQYKPVFTQAVAQKKSVPPPPAPPDHPVHAWGPGNLYNGMIAPLVPYAIRGAIWYQGESNAGRAYEYRTLLPAMIKNWRADWQQGDFPFLIVQLAPFYKIEAEPKESQWAELREAQLLTALHVPKTAVAVITDVGHETDIHPRWKEPVGARLALAARALANGETIEYSGPIYQGMKVDGNKIVLSFSHVGGGLVAKGGPLVGFTVAGDDRKFVKAEAEIQEDHVVVWNSKVEHPIAVRFGWANYPVVNFWNKAGLPASPFRTDDFPMLTNPNAPKAAVSIRAQ
jgi:sialate O-acetylesterase